MHHPALRTFAGRFLGFASVMIGLLCAGSSARGDNPMLGAQLTAVFPPGGKQASTVEVATEGTNIDDATSLVFSHPGLSGTPKMIASPVDNVSRPVLNRFMVTISGTVPPGLYEVRTSGPAGISNPRTFAVGSLGEVVDRDPPEKLSAARELPLESTVSAVMGSERADYFKFSAKKGQRLLLETAARQIDSRLDPRLVLYDAAGHELARAKERFHRDPFMDFVAPADGTYVVKLYDFLYKGGPDYFYRLTISSAPRLDFIMPPSGVGGSKAKYTLFGRNLPGGTATSERTASGTPLERLDVEIQLPANPAAVQHFGGDAFAETTQFALDAFAYRLQTPGGESNPINIYFATAPVVLEQEPNNTPAEAQKLSLPCEVAGQFNPRGDQDWFQFEAKKGDAWTIEVFSQQMGLSTDPYLLVQRVNRAANGHEEMVDVAESDDPAPDRRHEGHVSFLKLELDDPIVHFEAPQDGTYRVLVRDLYGESRGRPEYVYRLAIHRPMPDFRVLISEESPGDSDNNERMALWSPVVHRGRSTAATVMAQRKDGFSGEIQVSVEGLPPGITCPGATIGPGADVASLVFAAADQAGPKLTDWNGPIRVVAKARIGQLEVAHDVRVAASLWPVQQANQETVQFRLAPQFLLATSGNSMPQIRIDLAGNKPLEAAPGVNLKVPVKVVRGENAKGRLKCRLAGACRGMNVQELDIPADASDGTLQMNFNSQLPPGKYSLPLRVYASVNCRNNPEAADAASSRLKSLEKAVGELATAAHRADDAKHAAEKAAADSDTAVRHSLESIAAADRTLHELDERVQAAADALAPLEKGSADAAAKLQAAEAAQAKAGKAVIDAKGADAKTVDAKSADYTAALKAQSDAAEAVRKAREESRLADARRDAGRAAAQTAAVQRTSAEAAKSIVEKRLADATALAKSTAAARTAAQTAAADAAAKSHAADDEKRAADERARRANEIAQPRDYTLVVYSAPLQLEFDAAPLAMSISAPKPAKPSEKIDVPLQLERRFGFADTVYAALVLPPNVSGLHGGDVTIAAGQTKATLAVQLDPQIKPGDYNATIRARMTFNGQGSQLDVPLVIQVRAAEAKAPPPKPDRKEPGPKQSEKK
ncbi:MAG TPA: hypothetical protein VHX65_18760 [Pirellulales bacterium]|nr:hypothetical protein [Pirellulales bacterium]